MQNPKAVGQAFIVTLLVFTALDVTWLVLVAANMYRNQLGAVLRPEPMLGAAIAFYPIYTFGLFVLAVRPALVLRSINAAAINAAVLGLTAYATFDLTNLAIIKDWTLQLAAVDMVWGVTVSIIAVIAGTATGLRDQAARPLSEPPRE